MLEMLLAVNLQFAGPQSSPPAVCLATLEPRPVGHSSQFAHPFSSCFPVAQTDESHLRLYRSASFQDIVPPLTPLPPPPPPPLSSSHSIHIWPAGASRRNEHLRELPFTDSILIAVTSLPHFDIVVCQLPQPTELNQTISSNIEQPSPSLDGPQHLSDLCTVEFCCT